MPFVARADRTRAGAGRASASMDRRRSTESLAVGVSMTSSIITDAISRGAARGVPPLGRARASSECVRPREKKDPARVASRRHDRDRTLASRAAALPLVDKNSLSAGRDRRRALPPRSRRRARHAPARDVARLDRAAGIARRPPRVDVDATRGRRRRRRATRLVVASPSRRSTRRRDRSRRVSSARRRRRRRLVRG